MAIKGKRRSKQRSAPRPPRHEPVTLPTPFLRRRWVQVAAGFLVGVLSMMLLLWVTNNIRENDAQADEGSKAADRLGGHRVPAGREQRLRQGRRGRPRGAAHDPRGDERGARRASRRQPAARRRGRVRTGGGRRGQGAEGARGLRRRRCRGRSRIQRGVGCSIHEFGRHADPGAGAVPPGRPGRCLGRSPSVATRDGP